MNAIAKKGKLQILGNNRGISIMGIFAKIYDKIYQSIQFILFSTIYTYIHTGNSTDIKINIHFVDIPKPTKRKLTIRKTLNSAQLIWMFAI